MALMDPTDFFDTSGLYVGTKAQLDARAGLRNGAIAWCSNGRKAGEGLGDGTGVPVYYDAAAGTWNSYRTDAELLT